ncbi:TetR/AcrR family transcriptional regulator [Micromonospora sp. Llam7]|uniref:TetR/AcrR family transcriptional regulator n=1 Tax=Micromonospora tarapacensis TaxID=2835305 RepID=UPI001C83C071|nr:TetR/AcrR family transcriptional regulator [Micromonospora tarapacensis]MBX7267659.1 TetR/AcrR family transcriptional regulator [Micromonospora tarapacensis]
MTTPRRGPGRPRRAEQRDTADVIVATAAGLFARRGFDAVGMREIAAACAVDVATVHHHVGTKVALYECCFARVFAAESEALARAVVAAREGLAGGPLVAMAALHELVDVFVDFLEDRPETTGLWLRRWLEPDRHAELDERYSAPLYRAVEQVLTEADAAGVLSEPQPHLAVRSLVWSVHAHVVGLLSGSDGARRRREFRTFAHRWLDRMYALP